MSEKEVLPELLGMNLKDVANSKYVRSFGPVPEIRVIDNRSYLSLLTAGISFTANADGRVGALFLHSEGHEQFHQFMSDMPDGLAFSDSRSKVRSKFGQPSESGGGQVDRITGKIPYWDLFDRKSYFIHVEYSDGQDKVILITLIHPNSLPR
jgi:hypothetical protein